MKTIYKDLNKIFTEVSMNIETYRKFKNDMHFPTLFIQLSEQSDKQEIVECVLDFLKKNALKEFNSLKESLVYTLTNSIDDIEEIFLDIEYNTVFTNSFEGLIAIDVTKLYDCLDNETKSFFINKISKIKESSNIIFFDSTNFSKNNNDLVKMLREEFIDMRIIDITEDEKTNNNALEIIIDSLSEHGIEYDDKTINAISIILTMSNIKTKKAFYNFKKNILCSIDFTSATPKLTSDILINKFKITKNNEKGGM